MISLDRNSYPRAHLALPYLLTSFPYLSSSLTCSRFSFPKLSSPPRRFEAFAYRAKLNLGPLLFVRLARHVKATTAAIYVTGKCSACCAYTLLMRDFIRRRVAFPRRLFRTSKSGELNLDLKHLRFTSPDSLQRRLGARCFGGNTDHFIGNFVACSVFTRERGQWENRILYNYTRFSDALL